MERNDVLIGIVFLFNLVGGGAILRWFFNVEHDRLNMKQDISYLMAGYEKMQMENTLLKTQLSEQQTEKRALREEMAYLKAGYEKLKTENSQLKTQVSQQSTEHKLLQKEFEYIQKGLAENQKSLEEIKGLLTNLLTKK